MNVHELFDDLTGRGVRLSIVNGTEINIRAPKGALTDADRAFLKDHKAELLDLLDWFESLPDVLVIPKGLNDLESIHDCIESQRKKRTAA